MLTNVDLGLRGPGRATCLPRGGHASGVAHGEGRLARSMLAANRARAPAARTKTPSRARLTTAQGQRRRLTKLGRNESNEMGVVRVPAPSCWNGQSIAGVSVRQVGRWRGRFGWAMVSRARVPQ